MAALLSILTLFFFFSSLVLADEPSLKRFIVTIKGERIEEFLSYQPQFAEKAIKIVEKVRDQPVFLAEIPLEHLAFFKGLNFQKGIEENQPVSINNVYVQEVIDLWHLDTLCKLDFSSNDGKYTFNYWGTGVDVYVFDTGIYRDHEDFESRAFRFASFTNSICPDDCNGHGTHVAGIVGGKKYGVSKNVTLYDVQVLESNGIGDMYTVTKALYFVGAELKKTSVGVMSLGGARSEALKTAAKYARDQGLIMVASAGNNADNACKYSPADSDDVITVAAHTPKGARADFSNYGECVETYSPGTSIKSAYIGSITASKTLSGTSMSAPSVAGIVATLLEENSLLNFQLAVQILTTQIKNDFAETDAPAVVSKAHSAPCSSRCHSQVIDFSPFSSFISFPETGAVAEIRGNLSSWVYYAENLSLETFDLVLIELVDGSDPIVLARTNNSNPLYLTREVEQGKTYQMVIEKNIPTVITLQLVAFLEMPLSCKAEFNCSSNGNCAVEVEGSDAFQMCLCFQGYYGDDCSGKTVAFIFESQMTLTSCLFIIWVAVGMAISFVQNKRKNRINELAPLLAGNRDSDHSYS